MAFAYDQIKFLDGRSVLLKPEIFDSQNSVGRRGSLQVVRDANQPEGYRIEIAIEMPEMGDMAGAHAHAEKLVVPPAELESLMHSEFNGAFTYLQRKPGGPTRTAP